MNKWFILRICWSQTDQRTVIVEADVDKLEEAKEWLKKKTNAHHIDTLAICAPNLIRPGDELGPLRPR